jgi:hypothetical protein
MIYYVEIKNNKIVAKGYGPTKLDEQLEVTKEIYNQLTRLPADFETDTEGNIISVIPAPEPEPQPQPPTIEDRLADIELALTAILGGAVS